MEQALEPPQPPPDFTPKDDDEEEEDDKPVPPGKDDDEDDEKGSAVHVVRNADRLRLWRQYIRGVHEPGEKRMRGRVLRWIRRVRRGFGAGGGG